MRLILVRHGETIAGPGCCVGQADIALSGPGNLSVEELARSWNVRKFSAPSRILMSDLSRATASAAPFVARFAVEPEPDVRLRELSFGKWDGIDWQAIERDDSFQYRRWSERWTELAPPGGETVAQLSARARSVLDELRLQHASADDTVLIVSHAGWIRAALSVLFDEPASQILTRPIDYARATVVQLDPNGAGVIASNTATLA
jgi:broad specificity phosphatase PhoE